MFWVIKMIYSENKNGFSFALDETVFEFTNNLTAQKNREVYEVNVKERAPIPKLEAGDRIILPVDEGMVVYADKDYVAGELDIKNMGGDFSSREGTVGLVAIERKGKFLLICPENGLHSGYSAVKKGELYDLSVYCKKEMKVFYGIYRSLKEMCDSYKKIKNVSARTLNEKIKAVPEAEKLIGGGKFWIWNDNYDEIMYSDHNCEENPNTGEALLCIADSLYNSGIKKAMFGIFFNGDSNSVEALYKKYGYIATQYDNYNDVFNPAFLDIVPNNRVKNCDYTFRRMKDYPDGVQVDQNGSLWKAWALRGFDGKMHSQNTLCPVVAAQRMKEEIPEIIKEYPYYKGRYIDVYGGTVSVCYSKEHPVTLDECLAVKKGAYKAIEEMGLIVGTEDGHELILDEIVYTEGMHSPVYFRINDAGRNHAHIYNEQQKEHIDRYMTDPSLRIPLWHLIYHDCLFTFPYWGDTTEMYPERVKDKILFACLYGCPPLYSFSVRHFKDYKDLIVESYKKITFVTQKTATLPMTDYMVLNDDYTLQKTVFGDKYCVVANFSDKEMSYENFIVAPKDYLFLCDGAEVK